MQTDIAKMKEKSMDDTKLAVDLGQQALIVAVKLAVPMLMAGLIVGVTVSVFQALTQIQEQTLSFIPKMLAVVGVLFVLMPWMLAVLQEYTISLYELLPEYFGR